MSFRFSRAMVAASVALLLLSGCDLLEPRTTSPFSGEQVTGEQLAAEAARYDATKQAEDLREQAEAERALRRLRTEAAVEARKLANSADGALIELQARTETAAQDVVERVAADQQVRDLEISAMQRSVDLALQTLDRQQQQRMAAWGVLKAIPAVQAVPGFGAIEGLIGPLLGVGVGAGAIQLTKRRLRRQLQETEAAAERVVDSIDVLSQAAPEVKAALTTHKALVDEWQGLAGKALVDRLQRGEKLSLVG